MALNYSHSHSPVFPAHMSDDNLVLPAMMVNGYLVDDLADKNSEEAYLMPWHAISEEAEERNYNCMTSESNSNDIVRLLPSDPFGMDMETTFTAITGWLDDLELDYGGYMRTNECMASQESCSLHAGWNMFYNGECSWGSFQVLEKQLVMKSYTPGNRAVEDRGKGVAFDNGFEQSHHMRHSIGCNSNSVEVPHQALIFALSYLGVKDILSVEMVCKSLFTSVRTDPFLWTTIHIDRPLNERITDHVLVQLANRVEGNLHCLNLVECSKITYESLRRILETNARLTKLCIPGCTRINIQSIVDIVKEYNSYRDVGGIKALRIGGLCGVNLVHFEELKVLLGVHNMKIESHRKPLFYHRDSIYLPYDDDRPLDIEICPRCEKIRLVYDCPAETCRIKRETSQACRACTLCIPRCAQCGRCINDTEFEETFCLELLCSDCFKQIPSYQRHSGQVG